MIIFIGNNLNLMQIVGYILGLFFAVLIVTLYFDFIIPLYNRIYCYIFGIKNTSFYAEKAFNRLTKELTKL